MNDIRRHAALLEVGIGYEEAIAFLKQNRYKFPKIIEIDIKGLEKAGMNGCLYYPFYKKIR